MIHRVALVKYQSGAVLVVSLIMLLLLTLIGTTGMSVTSLEEKMAGNMRDRNLAFQAAESALSAGETAAATAALTLSCPDVGGVNPVGYYLPLDVDCNGAKESTHVWDNADVWTDDAKSVVYDTDDDADTIDLADISANPRYIIEDMGAVDCSGSAVGSLDCHNYRVTARATGGTNAAVVIVQSILQI